MNAIVPRATWTKEEDAKLLHMKNLDVSWGAICLEFGNRSFEGVRSRYFKLVRVPGRVGRRLKYPPTLRYDAPGMEIDAATDARDRGGVMPSRPPQASATSSLLR